MKELLSLVLVLSIVAVSTYFVGTYFELNTLEVVLVYTAFLWVSAAAINTVEWFRFNRIKIVKHEPY